MDYTLNILGIELAIIIGLLVFISIKLNKK